MSQDCRDESAQQTGDECSAPPYACLIWGQDERESHLSCCRGAYLYVPSTYSHEQPSPLLVMLHGAGALLYIKLQRRVDSSLVRLTVYCVDDSFCCSTALDHGICVHFLCFSMHSICPLPDATGSSSGTPAAAWLAQQYARLCLTTVAASKQNPGGPAQSAT
jgi:hypothetical protein